MKIKIPYKWCYVKNDPKSKFPYYELCCDVSKFPDGIPTDVNPRKQNKKGVDVYKRQG